MGIGLPLLFVFLWSTGYVVAALVAPYSEPLSILSLRFVGAAGVLFVFGLIMRGKWPSPKRTIVIIVSGVFIHGIYLSCVFWGVKNGMPAGVSALLIGLQPLFTAVLAGPLLGERIYSRHWLGLVIGLIGCALVISPKLTVEATGITPATLGAHVIGVIAIVLGSFFQKRFVGAMNFKTEPCLQLTGGALVAIPIALATENFEFILSPELIGGYLWMTLILSCGAFTLYMVLLQTGETTKVASVFYLVPASSAIQGYLLFHETLNLTQIIGMAIATAAVALASDVFFKSRRE